MRNKKITLGLVALMGISSLTAQETRDHAAIISKNLEIFNDLYKQLDIFYVDSLNADTVIGWGIHSMLNRVDPFTEYYPDDNEDLRQMATGKYAGIGSVIRYHRTLDRVIIAQPYEGTPSAEVGLRAGDAILSIDGKDVKGMSTPDVSRMLRGEAGTTFELKVLRQGQEETFHITRRTIQTPQVPYAGLVTPSIGYIYLTGFTEGAAREVEQAAKALRQKGATRLILDLRSNPGGAVNEAVDITGLFVPKGQKVMFTKGKMTNMNREFFTASEPLDSVMPLAVLVDGGTASSSEIVAGALQDMDRAVILGSRTFGKGVVQTIRETPYHGNLKITTGRYYIPSGRCIQAYDYRHLNADGTAGTVPDSLTQVFHTAGGREVRDGGGIKPDVEIKPDSMPTLIYDLVQSDAFFDFVTHYVAEHPQIAPAGEISLSDEDYRTFADFVKESGFTYNRRSSEVLDLLKKVAQREGYLEVAQQEFDALEAKFTTDVAADLMRLSQVVKPFVEVEIAQRCYYEEGAARQQLTSDPVFDEAVRLLENPDEYKQILTKKP